MIYLVFILGGVGIFGRSLPVLFFLSGRFFIRFHTLSLSQPCYLPCLLILFLTSLLITAPPLFEFERANLQDQTKKNIHTLCFLGLICDTYFTLFFCYSLTLIVHTSSTPSTTSDARTSYLFLYLYVFYGVVFLD